MEAFQAYHEAKRDWFDNKYGENKWSLTTLATHRDYTKGGVGKALCCWGIQRAISNNLKAVTLFASPLGKLLYTKLGFKEVGTVHIQVEGEEEFVKFPGMTLELEGKDRSEFRLPRTFIFDQGSLGEKIICTLAQVRFDESNEASARPADRVEN
jgi:hypothetical protein